MTIGILLDEVAKMKIALLAIARYLLGASRGNRYLSNTEDISAPCRNFSNFCLKQQYQ